MSAYVVYDVFTDRAFGGNQLAVFPDASKIAEENFQKIAREFNFSETTFVLPPADPANTAQVRIFTPTNELQFAGHPTIGTATALRDLGHQGDMVLELGVGPIPCTFDGDTASFTTSAPLDRLSNPNPTLVAKCLGLAPHMIRTDTHVPSEVGLGTPFVLVELAGRQALADCVTDIAAMREGAANSSDPRRFAVMAYIRDSSKIDARMFAPLGNIPEDPATGSAAAALAAFLHETLDAPQDLAISQGVDMGRPSLILASTAGQPVQVTISGQAIMTMKGEFLV